MSGSSNEDHIGQVLLESYYIDRLLASGPFSRVYHGRSPSGMEVAVKVLTDTSPIVLHYYYREVKVLRALAETQHVVHYLEDGRLGDGTPVLVTEFIDGVTLWNILTSQRRFAPETSVQFVIELCQAIEPLHMLGLVHRDLKPNNVMLQRDGLIRLIDLGLVRDAQGIFKLLEEEEPERGRVFAREIDTGVLAGTISYMAPEQFSDALLDDMKAARTDTYSDIFSIGVILYELLSLQKPFQVSVGTDFRTIVDQRLRLGNADIAPLNGVEASLESIVMKALDEVPRRRHTNARELREELEGYLEHGSGAYVIPERQTIRVDLPTDFDQLKLPETVGAQKRRRFNAATVLLEGAGEETMSWPGSPDDRHVTYSAEAEEATVPDRGKARALREELKDAYDWASDKQGQLENPQILDDEVTVPNRIAQASTLIKTPDSTEHTATKELSPDDEEPTSTWRRDD